MTMRTILAALLAASLGGPALAEPATDSTPPPAAPAPAAAPVDATDLSSQLDRLAEARRDAVVAERELRNANAALARAEHDGAGPGKLARLRDRRDAAQSAFDVARLRVPELVTQARAAGLSAAAVRSYEHSLYGE